MRTLSDPFRIAAIGLVGLHLAITLAMLFQPGWGLDEQDHAAYAVLLLQQGSPTVDFWTAQRLTVDLSGWSECLGVNHPPPYYWLMALVAAPFDGLATQLTAMRGANVVLSLATVLLMARLAERLFEEVALRLLFLALLVVTPWLPLLGSRVTNDNLILLGATLFALGAWDLLSGRPGRQAWTVTAVGLMLTAVTKATAALMVGFAFGPLLLLLLWRQPALLRRPAPWLTVVAALLSLIPYVYFQWRFGSPVPYSPALMESHYTHAAAMGWTERYGLPGYLVHFFYKLFANLHPIAGASAYDHWPQQWQWQAILVFVAGLLALQAAGVAVSVRRLLARHGTALDWLILLGGVALLGTIAINIVFVYKLHRLTGWLDGVWARYYLPFAFVPAAASCSCLGSIAAPRLRHSLAGLVVVGLLASYLMSWR